MKTYGHKIAKKGMSIVRHPSLTLYLIITWICEYTVQVLRFCQNHFHATNLLLF